MHHLSSFSFCCVFIVLFSCVVVSVETDTLRSNVENAVISILVENYNGSNGALNKEQLKSLIDATVGESHDQEAVDIQDIVHACSDSGNLTICKEVISAKVSISS